MIFKSQSFRITIYTALLGNVIYMLYKFIRMATSAGRVFYEYDNTILYTEIAVCSLIFVSALIIYLFHLKEWVDSHK